MQFFCKAYSSRKYVILATEPGKSYLELDGHLPQRVYRIAEEQQRRTDQGML